MYSPSLRRFSPTEYGTKLLIDKGPIRKIPGTGTGKLEGDRHAKVEISDIGIVGRRRIDLSGVSGNLILNDHAPIIIVVSVDDDLIVDLSRFGSGRPLTQVLSGRILTGEKRKDDVAVRRRRNRNRLLVRRIVLAESEGIELLPRPGDFDNDDLIDREDRR